MNFRDAPRVRSPANLLRTMPTKTLKLVPYDHTWPALCEAAAARLTAALGTRAQSIEHIGSTSVPGLLAKPVIDIGVAVSSADEAEACVAPLQTLGYEYRGMHGDDPARRYFVLDGEGRRRVQIHMWILPAAGWERHLRFRDLLRARPDLAAAYAREKLRVAEAAGWDKAAYSVAKGPFIEALLRGEG
jgi:GrpB-like predicted nucleotidyltransferase (UPF0157 family)